MNDWRDDAACLGYPSDWFFEEESYELGRSRCRVCPVSFQCLEHALDNNEFAGLWAGYTGRQRVQLKRQRRRNQSATRKQLRANGWKAS